MKAKLTSLRLRMLLPVIATTLFVVILLTMLFSRAFINMILQQENEVNNVGFDTVSRTVPPLISTSITEVRNIMADDRVVSYARYQYASAAERIRAQMSCRDYLRGEIARQNGIYGILFMRKDGSLFGALPDGSFFWDNPLDNPFPEAITAQILHVQLGKTIWVGPLSATVIYGFENDKTRTNVMICAWKSVDVSYGECFALMLMDDEIFGHLFDSLEDQKSVWRLFTADQTEIYHTGAEACKNPEKLLSESNSESVFYNEYGRPVCAFSMTMTSPAWTLVREVSMENYEQAVRRIRYAVAILGSVVLLIALAIYRLWLRKFMYQFDSLLDGIVRIGQGDLKPYDFEPSSINEFKTMQNEIHRTGLALSDQMDTIRRMEREQMELENKRKEQEQLVRELSMAREIQKSSLPHIFPAFPERKEIDLFASMDPARDVGGDFYHFFFIDEDHLCLIIADVSGKGIPAAMFMMVAKRILEDTARLAHSVSEILEKTNETLCDNNQAEMFVTVWLGILELSTGKLTAANAGHEYPVLYRKDGAFELYKDKHGIVIGAMKGVRYREYQLEMSPGDKLFVYTDGVPEATALSGEMYGTERMTAALNACADGSPDEILRGVRESIDGFVGDAEQFDDLTMMCLEYRGKQESTEEGT